MPTFADFFMPTLISRAFPGMGVRADATACLHIPKTHRLERCLCSGGGRPINPSGGGARAISCKA
eukprot:8900726-Pyramimonas_sp.AAC.1